jgi:hypothetical protein
MKKVIKVFEFPSNWLEVPYKQYPFDPNNQWFDLKICPADLTGSLRVEVKSIGRKWVYYRNKKHSPNFKKVSRRAWDSYRGEEISEEDKWKYYKKDVKKYKSGHYFA